MNGKQPPLGLYEIDATLADIYVICEDAHGQKEIRRPIVVTLTSKLDGQRYARPFIDLPLLVGVEGSDAIETS